MPTQEYENIREIGRGAYGVVFEVRRRSGGNRTFALKQLLPSALTDTEYVQRFKREVRILGVISHPGIVQILDADLDDDPPWFVMPLAESSLDRIIPLARGLTEQQIQVIFDHVLAAIAFAHRAGVLHRDLKPHNVLMIEDLPVIADFGLGRRLDSSSTTLTVTGGRGGTFGYVAPEQWTGLHEVDERADIYALGSLLFEMATGLNPVAITRQALPPRFAYVINRSREHDPSRRYQSVETLREDFQRLFVPDSQVTTPVDRAGELADGAAENTNQRRELIELYLRHPADVEFYRSTVPQWPAQLLRVLADEEPEALASIIQAFDDHVSGNLDFEFVDTVADFLQRVYLASDDPELRRLVLARVLLTGEYHQRWHAGNVFAQMLATVRSADDALMVRHLLFEHRNCVEWANRWINPQNVVPLIRDALSTIPER